MAYEIVKFEDDSGKEISITPNDVRQTFCPNATDKEIQLFMALCANQRLNPYTKEAYLVKYGNAPAQMITARAAFQKRADANPDFEGTEIGTVVMLQNGTIEHLQGEAYYPMAGQQLIGGWARVYRRGRKPYYTEVPLHEYSTGKSNWAKMPSMMIVKVAEVHALRGAFPSDFQGMYSEEEMDQAIESTSEPTNETPVEATYEPPTEVMDKPSQGPSDQDKAELRRLTNECVALGYEERGTAKWLYEQYKQGGIDYARERAESLMTAKIPDVADEDIEF